MHLDRINPRSFKGIVQLKMKFLSSFIMILHTCLTYRRYFENVSVFFLHTMKGNGIQKCLFDPTDFHCVVKIRNILHKITFCVAQKK